MFNLENIFFICSSKTKTSTWGIVHYMFYFLSLNWKNVLPDKLDILWNIYLYNKNYIFIHPFYILLVSSLSINNVLLLFCSLELFFIYIYPLYTINLFLDLYIFFLHYFPWLYKKHRSWSFSFQLQLETNTRNISDRSRGSWKVRDLFLNTNIFSKTNTVLRVPKWGFHLLTEHKKMFVKGVPMKLTLKINTMLHRLISAKTTNNTFWHTF